MINGQPAFHAGERAVIVAHVNTVAFQGIDTLPIDVQVTMANGLPAFTIVVTGDLSHYIYNMAKAYSYLRFSTPEQQQGDSFRRQISMAREYAIRHHLDLDNKLTFQDLGVSAYRGRNVETGQLGAFKAAVESGLVPTGSYLLVESLDRISRQTARRALRTLEDIVDLGVTVVTLSDDRKYTADSLDDDPTALLMSVLIFMRAAEESATKGRRLRAAWHSKRTAAAAERKPMTRIAPSWLQLKADRSGYEVIPERAKIVRKVFELYLRGSGYETIARTLNEGKVPTWGRAQHWHRSYIVRLLRNPATIGTFVVHETTHQEGKRKDIEVDRVEGYFPPVVDKTTWGRAHDLLNRPAAQRGRHAARPLKNVFAGLAKCPRCGGSMLRTSKGKKNRVLFVCGRAKAGAGCEYYSVPYDDAEEALLVNVDTLIADAPSGDDKIDGQLFSVNELGENLATDIEMLLDMAQEGDRSVLKRVRKLERELDELKNQRDELLRRREEISNKLVQHRLEELRASCGAEHVDLSEINRALRLVVSDVVIDYEHYSLDFDWRHGGTSSVPVGWTKGLAKLFGTGEP
jgi:DNA invertase Pin-like site-specific DNA recombinase